MSIRLSFLPLTILCAVNAAAAPVHLVDQAPARIMTVAPGVQWVDFGRVAFGNLRLHPPAGTSAPITVHFGEALTADGRVDRQPPGTVRYQHATFTLAGTPIVAAPPPDGRNTWDPATMDYAEWSRTPGTPRSAPPPAILTPRSWGVVLPFRWVEIEGWPGELRPEQIVRRAAFASSWDDAAADFSSSDPMLDRVWALCRYSIKATTFAGMYVDGDRERIPYEADAHLNQLSHYATANDAQMARDTFDHLMAHGTWPTEWASHMVFMAHADWWHTGDRDWIDARYEALRTKLLLERVGEDGLVHSTEENIRHGDIVDWPLGARDGFEFTACNAVVNAFYLRALEMMAEMGRALGREALATEYETRCERGRAAFQANFIDAASGLCRDGIGTDHKSLHANLFALRFGLVPPARAATVAAWLQTRGMDCSVYVAQYYMEALFRADGGRRALALMLAPGDRSWRHMVESGATIAWEAWDLKYKRNQDWNHAWGAAPANLLPRFVLGVEAAAPGWARARIAPQPSGLSHAQGKVPTPRGPINVAWREGDVFSLEISLPETVSAEIRLPVGPHTQGVRRDGTTVAATREAGWWILPAPITGTARLEAF